MIIAICSPNPGLAIAWRRNLTAEPSDASPNKIKGKEYPAFPIRAQQPRSERYPQGLGRMPCQRPASFALG